MSTYLGTKTIEVDGKTYTVHEYLADTTEEEKQQIIDNMMRFLANVEIEKQMAAVKK